MSAPTVEPVRFDHTDLDQIGDTAARALLAWWALRGDVERGEWVRGAAGLLLRYVVSARAWGRVRAGFDLPSLPGLDLPGVTGSAGFFPDAPPAVDDDELLERLEQAWETVYEVAEDRPDPDATAERLARDEPIAAAQSGYQDVLAEAGVTGYRRAINPDACELCQWLQKSHLRPGGFVYPINQPMYRHTGCRCLPEPTTDPIRVRPERDYR